MIGTMVSADFLNAILRAATPILFAALASSVAQKSGVVNMALEGTMLFCALFGVIFTAMTGSFLIGLLLTVLVGAFIGLVLAFFILDLKTDAILAAIAMNLIATGATVLILLAYSGERGASSSLSSIAAPTLVIPFVNQIPVIGKVVSGQNLLTYLALAAVAAVHLFLYKTPFGLSLRSVGENQDAAESVGISSRRVRYLALVISGILASFGGFFLSGGYMNMFTKDMTAGRGFIALAASAMGGNTPIGGFFVSLLFGAAQALANVMQMFSGVPYELIQMLPYITSLVGLALYSYGKMRKIKRLEGRIS